MYTNKNGKTAVKKMLGGKKILNEIAGLKAENAQLRKENAELRKENAGLQKENAELRAENAALRKENTELRAEISRIMSSMDQRIAIAVEAAVAPLRVEIEKKDAEILKLENEICRLQGIIKKDSSNSSKPPSQNGYKKVMNSREPSERKSGGQPGHAGHRLKLPENMAELLEKGTAEIDLVDYTRGSSEYISRWEIDLKIVTIFREYRYALGATLPEKHYNEVSYGDNLKALTVLLSNEGIIAEERLTELFESITHGVIRLSDSTVDSILRQFSGKLDGELTTIRDDLLNGSVMGVDDTPMRCTQRAIYDEQGVEAGVETATKTTHNVYVRTHSNEQSTLYTVNPRKNKEGVERDNILPNYIGILSHDHEKKFYLFGRGHGTCCEHLGRELKGLDELQNNPYRKNSLISTWAAEMRGFIYDMNQYKNNDLSQEKTACDADKLAFYMNCYDKLLAEGWEDLAKQGKDAPGHDTFNALLKRLQEYKGCYMQFMVDYKVPFTNNLSERDLRPCKTKQKVSGCFRSWPGIQHYARTRSFISTLKKRSFDLFDSILLVIKGQPVL